MSNINQLIATANNYQPPAMLDPGYRQEMQTRGMQNELAKQQLATFPEQQKLEQEKMRVSKMWLDLREEAMKLGPDIDMDYDFGGTTLNLKGKRDDIAKVLETYAKHPDQVDANAIKWAGVQHGVSITGKKAEAPIMGDPAWIKAKEEEARINAKYRAPEKPEKLTFDERGFQDWSKKAENVGKGVDDYLLWKKTTETKGEKKDYKIENQLRDEYNTGAKPFIVVRDSYSRIMASAKNPSAAGDLSMIYNYMKMLDPGSTVREGEFATAAATGSYGDRIKEFVNKVLTGQRLSAEVRQDFLTRSSSIFKEQQNSHSKFKSEYERLAKSHGVSPSDVIVDYNTISPEQANDPYEVGAVYEDAKGSRKKYAGNGKWDEAQ
jgi:ribosomal protein L18